MSKDKKRKQGNSHSSMVSDEARYVLVGLLVFLLCFIGLIERGGYLGNIVSYIFVYMFGVFWFLPLIMIAIFGLYLFIRRKLLKIKIGVPQLAFIFFILFLLIGASENEIGISNVLNVYNDHFNQISGNGWQVVIDAHVGGGFIGFVLFALLSDLITSVGAKVVYIVGLLLTLLLFLKPLLYKFVEYIKNDEKYERKLKSKKETSNSRNGMFKNLYEELNLGKGEVKNKETEYSARDSFMDEQLRNVEVESVGNSYRNKPIINEEKETHQEFDDFFKDTSSKNTSKFNVFNNSFDEVDERPSYSSYQRNKYEVKGFDVFNENLYDEDKKTSQVKYEEEKPTYREVKMFNVEEDYLALQKDLNVPSKITKEDIVKTNVVVSEEPIQEVINEAKQEKTKIVQTVVDVTDEDIFETKGYTPKVEKIEATEIKEDIKEEVVEEKPLPSIYKSNSAPTNVFINDEPKAKVVEEKRVELVSKPVYEEVKTVSTPEPPRVEKVAEIKQEKPLTAQEAFDAKNDPTIKPKKPYKLPTINLLNDIKYSDMNAQIQNAQIKSIQLNGKMASLNIKGHVANQIIAPAFTRYEVEVESNVKVSLFNQYKNDLMMALSAETIRILAPIPGSEFVGIEIPNKERITVSFKESMLGLPYEKKDKKLLVAVGKDIEGKSVSVQIDKTPHLLVAGTTGSGKSVCINTIIMSILMRTTPDEVKLILVDPKRVELAAYSSIPHLLCPVITDPKKASVALRKVCEEMDLRYGIFEKTGKRNIEMYNSWQVSRGGKALPYIVVIVDELADLMQVASSDVEDSIRRITQLARAAGIHLIVATQRPSVDVITGVIKANIPSRIAFTVSSNADSRTILDEVGAENLLGMGDMLIKLTGSLNCQRVQGCFVADEEIERVTEYAKSQREPEYDVKFLNLEPPKPEQLSLDGEIDSEESEDPTYLEILDLIKNLDTVSASYLQRKFGIGFPKAGRYIDRLEKEGYIGEQQGSKPREVLK